MVKKRTSLETLFADTDKSETDEAGDIIVEDTAGAPAINTAALKLKRNQNRASRNEATDLLSGKNEIVKQTVYLPVGVYEQLRQLAFEERRKMHDYLVEGLDRVFKNRGLKPYEDLSGKAK